MRWTVAYPNMLEVPLSFCAGFWIVLCWMSAIVCECCPEVEPQLGKMGLTGKIDRVLAIHRNFKALSSANRWDIMLLRSQA